MLEEQLRELYQELVFDHGMAPRHRESLEGCERQNEQFNPMCGDRVCVGLSCKSDGHIIKAAFQGEGCAISMASTSLMLEALQDKNLAEAEQLLQSFFDLIYQRDCDKKILGKIAVLQGVCQYPARVKCATLPWHALEALLRKSDHV